MLQVLNYVKSNLGYFYCFCRDRSVLQKSAGQALMQSGPQASDTHNQGRHFLMMFLTNSKPLTTSLYCFTLASQSLAQSQLCG